METLGEATRRAIERTGRRAVLLASNSLSHLHWDTEPDLPEDMGVERPFNHAQYAGDMELLATIRDGPTSRLKEAVPAHIEATSSETKAGSLTWLMAAMGWPAIAGDVLAYGTVIATGNAVVEWVP
jgi:2-aminophenol/2-amino-5-chlorophenol 1,6-dioxygenase beta subunit